MFNLNQLNHFRLVAETGSFAAAAQKAFITQPALSNSIHTLEDRMGLQLFDRSSRPVRLTPGGRDVLGRIDTLLAEARNLEKEIRYLSQGLEGELKVGMTAHSSASIGGVILGRWLASHPMMNVELYVADTLELVGQLRTEELDLIVGEGRDLPLHSSDFEMVPIPEQQGYVFCRAGHPALELPKITFRDLLPYRFSGSNLPVALLDNMAELFGLSDRSQIEIAVVGDNISVMRDVTMYSNLILLTTRGCVRDAIAANLLVELPIDLETQTTWHVATLRNSVLHPATLSLRDAIVKTACEMA